MKRLPFKEISPVYQAKNPAKTQWSWIVAFACCWINVFLFGIFRSAGVLYRTFVDTFNCTYQEASWPISMAGSVASVTGIVTGFLTHYFDIRSLVFFGILICSFAISICYFASTMIFIIISLGFIQGIGIGLVTNLLPAIITQYFGKQRAAACGVSYAGSTIGAFVFPLFIEWQLLEFGLKGTMLLMGAITLHGLIGSLLLRPVNFFNQPRNKNKSTLSKCSELPENKLPLIEACDTRVYLENVNAHKLNSVKERPKSIADFSVVVTMRDHRSERHRNRRMSLPLITNKQLILEQKLAASQQLYQTTAPKKKSFFQDVLRHLLSDSKILLNLHFHLCIVVYIVFILNFVSFLIILPDYAKDRGLTEHQGTLLLSLYSVTDLLGRLVPGWTSYLEIMTNKNIFVSSITFMGICFIMMPLANNFINFAILTLSCGFFTGCQMVLPPVIVSEYVGVEKTAVAWGLANFFCGSLTLILRPLLIGIKDQTGEYDTLFYIMGLMAITSAAFWIIDSFRSKCTVN